MTTQPELTDPAAMTADQTGLFPDATVDKPAPKPRSRRKKAAQDDAA